MDQMERRTYPADLTVETRVHDGSTELRFSGHAAVFNQNADLGWYEERVDPGAFDKTLSEDSDIRALFNHDPNIVLGRNKAETLELGTDKRGLKFSIDPPDTQPARDLAVSIERKDVDQASFAFRVVSEKWDYAEDRGKGAKKDLRTLLELSLHNGDISPVTYPAYEGTDTGIAARRFAEWRSSHPSKPQSVSVQLNVVGPTETDRSLRRRRAREAELLTKLDES